MAGVKWSMLLWSDIGSEADDKSNSSPRIFGDLHICSSDKPCIGSCGYFQGFVAYDSDRRQTQFCGFLQIISVQVKWKLGDK